MDAAKLQAAIDRAGGPNLSLAVRVFRHGCLVGEDRAAAASEQPTYESWSMAKSVVSLIFGRAMTLGLILPDDPVGSLLPVADRAHGAVTMRDLLTMSSGVEWNPYRDYNIFSMPDRVHDWLTLRMVHPPGTYFEYAQSAVAVLAEAIGRAVGEDIQEFAQRELLDPLGIPKGSWFWERDRAGRVQGFTGVNMRPTAFARLGELLRRGGVFNGRRLLSRRYLREAIAPSATNGCYGWLIWVNAGRPCIGPTVTDRPYADSREYPDLPADLYRFAGLFGQIVAIFPSQDVEVVRLGEDAGVVLSGGSSWEHDLYTGVLGSITDEPVGRPGDASPAPRAAKADKDYGFQTAIADPARYQQGAVQDPLPAAGPERMRALRLRLAHPRPSRAGVVTVRATCPAQAPRACAGRAALSRAAAPVAFDLPRGATRILRFRLTAASRRALRRAGSLALDLAATTVDAGGGTLAALTVNVRR